jgi:hypothetical protein
MKTFLFRKKNFRHIFGIGAMVCAALFAGCEKEDEPNNPNKPGDPNVETTVNVVMKNASVSGVVRDTDGNFLEGVKVTTGTQTTRTNVAGVFLFQEVGTVDSRSVIRFEKDNYFPITRSGVSRDEINVEVVLHSKGNSDISVRTNFDASSAKTLSVGNMKVNVPASSVVEKDGTSYSGTVYADMLYLDPNHANFNELMPGGDLAAVRTDNSTAQLISYGMTEVSLTDDSGNPLQLAEGAKSEMTFPIPAGMESNPPSTIPLWYFNENTGLWVEEGTATLKGNVYVGTVEHFSWHNLDYPEDRIEIKGTVTDCNDKPLSKVKITVEETGGLNYTSTYTNSRGEYAFFAPANTPLTVVVKSKDYSGYTPEVSHNIPGKTGGTVVTQDIGLPCMNYISGTLINTCGTVIAAKIRIEYTENGKTKTTDPEIVSSADGKFRYRIPAITGQVTFYAESLSGVQVSKTITLTSGSEQNITLQLCMELKGLLVTASDETGKGFSLAIPNEGFTIHIGASPLNFPRHDVDIYWGRGGYSGDNYSEDYLVNLGWYDYEPGKTKYVSEPKGMWTYSGIWINEGSDAYGGEFVIDAYGVEFEILNREGYKFSISVKADGTYWIPGGGFTGEFPVHIEGIIDAQLDIYNFSRLDVASHTNFVSFAKEEMSYWEGYLHEPYEDENWEPYRDPVPVFDVDIIPALPVPFDEVFTSAGEHADEFFDLCWKNATRATFDDIVQRFKDAGFNVDDIRESTIGFNPLRPYFSTTGYKGDTHFVISFDPEGGKLLPDYGVNYGRSWTDENGFTLQVELRR